MSGFTAFIFVYLKHDIGISNEMLGVAVSVAALAEIPPMILIDVLLRRLSVRTTMILGTVGIAASWMSFALITSATWIIPLMILRGTVYTLQAIYHDERKDFEESYPERREDHIFKSVLVLESVVNRQAQSAAA